MIPFLYKSKKRQEPENRDLYLDKKAQKLPPKLLDRNDIIGNANQRISSFRKRFKEYKVHADSNNGQRSRVEREYKKTINFTLIDIQDLINNLTILSNEDHQDILAAIRKELEECYAILDSCLNSLEVSQLIGNHTPEENILRLEYRFFKKGGSAPLLDTSFVLGVPVDHDFRLSKRNDKD